MADWNWNCYSCKHNKNTIPPCDKVECEYESYCTYWTNNTEYYTSKDGTSVCGINFDGTGEKYKAVLNGDFSEVKYLVYDYITNELYYSDDNKYYKVFYK